MHIYASFLSFKIQVDFELSYNFGFKENKRWKVISFHIWCITGRKCYHILTKLEKLIRLHLVILVVTCIKHPITHGVFYRCCLKPSLLWQWFTDCKTKQVVNPVPYMEYLTTHIYKVIYDATKSGYGSINMLHLTLSLLE